MNPCKKFFNQIETKCLYMYIILIKITHNGTQLQNNNLVFTPEKYFLSLKSIPNGRFDLSYTLSLSFSFQLRVILDLLQALYTKRFLYYIPWRATISLSPFKWESSIRYPVAITISPHLKSSGGPRDCINSLDRIQNTGRRVYTDAPWVRAWMYCLLGSFLALA